MKKIQTLSPSVVIENAQLKAVESILIKSYESFERKVRRWFSKNFSTPYMDTFQIPWEELLLHFYEAGLESKAYNEVLELAMSEYLPEFIHQVEQEDEEFAKGLLEEQEALLKKKKAKEKQREALAVKTSPAASSELKTDKEQSIKKDQKTAKSAQPKPKSMSVKFDDQDPDED